MALKKKMTFGGVGPSMALICLPYAALSIIILAKYPEFLSASSLISRPLSNAIGWTLAGIGTLFYIATVFVFMRDFKKGILMKTGPYGLCRNPIYATWILFAIPALAFLFQSWLLLSIDLPLYIAFKLAIHGEYIVLKENFGKEYDDYEKNVNEILPFPKFWKKA